MNIIYVHANWKMDGVQVFSETDGIIDKPRFVSFKSHEENLLSSKINSKLENRISNLKFYTPNFPKELETSEQFKDVSNSLLNKWVISTHAHIPFVIECHVGENVNAIYKHFNEIFLKNKKLRDAEENDFKKNLHYSDAVPSLWKNNIDIANQFNCCIIGIVKDSFRIYEAGFEIELALNSIQLDTHEKRLEFCKKYKKELIKFTKKELIETKKIMRKIGAIQFYHVSSMVLKRDSTLSFIFQVNKEVNV